jgi:arylsulfatase A-like enzyme/Tfp pilus assembly protein PilF
MRKVVLFVSAAAILATCLFYWDSLTIKPGEFRDSNIVLITVDTLRADHLPAYGYNAVKTPAMDRLAAESVLFEDAVAHVPMTLPSHASILTGLLPPSHGIRDNAGFILDSKIKTLAEILKEHGYQTAAFVSAFVLDSQFKLDQGFDVYSDDFVLAEARVSSLDVYRRAEETQMEVDAWLQKTSGQKFFLWIHYYDPHDPYEPPEPYNKVYANSLYDGEIAYTDFAISKLMERLNDPILKENTIVIFTSDHGEGLGEHNEKTHSLFIYNSTQHVPLMIRLPTNEPRRVKQIVSHIDIAPTILDLIGLESQVRMQGVSLIPDLNGKTRPARAAYSESLLAELHYGWSPLKGITTGEYKFIEAPRPELYNRKTDPHERTSVANQNPEMISNFQKQLAEMLRSAPEQTTPAKIDDETEEKLRALGYIGSIVQSTPESRKIDPKDRIQILQKISEASAAMETKQYEAALRALESVIREDPQLVDAQYMAANAHLHLGNQEQALGKFLETIRLKPDHRQSLYNVAFFYHTHGNLSAAEHWYKELLQYEPDHLFGNLNLASLYRQKGEHEKAEPYIRTILSAYEESIRSAVSPAIRSQLLEKVAEIRSRTGNQQDAIRDLEQSTKTDPRNFEAWWKLGSLYRKEKRLNRAIECFRNAIAANRQFYPAYYSLSETYLAANTNLKEALELAETAYEKEPREEANRLIAALRAKVK